MNRADVSTLLKKKIRSKDGMLIGTVTGLEVDLDTLRITGIRCEASRDILERLNLAEPSITGGRDVVLDGADVSHVRDEVHLGVDALDLAKLNYKKLDSMA